MTSTTLPKPLRGIIPPMATPLLDQDRLDHAGLERLIEHILAGGVHRVVVALVLAGAVKRAQREGVGEIARVLQDVVFAAVLVVHHEQHGPLPLTVA